MPYTATWTVQPDASLRADYTDPRGDPCHLAILPEGGAVQWSAVTIQGTRTSCAPYAVDVMAAAEDEAARLGWSHVEPDHTAEEQDLLGQAAVDLLRGPGHGR